MRTASMIAGFLLVIQPTIDIAQAVEPAHDIFIGDTIRQDALVVSRHALVESGAIILPPCRDGVRLLLGCIPRPEVVFDSRDIGILNRIATMPRARKRPYTQNFSWD